MAKVETIYSFLPKVEIKIEKPPLYKSTYKQKVRTDWTKSKKTKATFGPLQEERPHQSQFLKAGFGNTRLLKNRKIVTEKHIKEVIKGPTFHDINNLPVQEEKDFIVSNIHAIETLETKRVDPEKCYLEKKDYGQVPEYLVKAKAAIIPPQSKKILALVDNAPIGYKYMPESERIETVSILEAKLKELNKEYGKLSLIIDTVPKKNKKINLENCIDEIESYLEELKSSKKILIRLDE
eukprot:NODE_39_length_35218_cov_0.479655.p23 type:complete len:237 gc:universal NODE_39_length_35218_cov_0.479655:25000-24290(-)